MPAGESVSTIQSGDPPAEPSQRHLLGLVSAVADPEIPVITLGDLGIVRRVMPDGIGWIVELTPTYSGCPATEVIRDDVLAAARAGGYTGVAVRLVLSPPWSTRWITDSGRDKLRAYGIAPPADDEDRATAQPSLQVIRLHRKAASACPRCGSTGVELISQYGSTPCKALYRCLACREPFDYFKPY